MRLNIIFAERPMTGYSVIADRVQKLITKIGLKKIIHLKPKTSYTPREIIMDVPISISIGIDLDLAGLNHPRLEMIAQMICLSKKDLFYERTLWSLKKLQKEQNERNDRDTCTDPVN